MHACRSAREAEEARQALAASQPQLQASEAEVARLRAELGALQAAGQSWGRERDRLVAIEEELQHARNKVLLLCPLCRSRLHSASTTFGGVCVLDWEQA